MNHQVPAVASAFFSKLLVLVAANTRVVADSIMSRSRKAGILEDSVDRTSDGAERTSPRMTTGLVAGKFDPPHRGHALLIDTARARCDRLIVLLFDYEGQRVPAGVRAGWLRDPLPGTAA